MSIYVFIEFLLKANFAFCHIKNNMSITIYTERIEKNFYFAICQHICYILMITQIRILRRNFIRGKNWFFLLVINHHNKLESITYP